MKVMIVGLSKAKGHILQPLWGEYRRGSWGVYKVESVLELAMLGWIRYEAPIDAGLIEVISTSRDQQEVAIRTMNDCYTVMIPKQNGLEVDAVSLMTAMESVGHNDIAQVVMLRIEDLTKMTKGK
jgi:hypothetical protein